MFLSSVLPLLPSSTTASSPNTLPNWLYQEGAGQGDSVAMLGGGTPGIRPWSAPACLEPPMLSLFLLSPWERRAMLSRPSLSSPTAEPAAPGGAPRQMGSRGWLCRALQPEKGKKMIWELIYSLDF